jgi:hypothetical protein
MIQALLIFAGIVVFIWAFMTLLYWGDDGPHGCPRDVTLVELLRRQVQFVRDLMKRIY